MVADGILVVDKPSGITSFGVVRRVRRAAGVKRVGHGGTLDPLASGVLPVCFGEATKVLQFLLDADKEYEVTLRLGVETDSYDSDGQVTARRDPAGIDEAAVRAALPAFTGRVRQVPPAFSALKHAGRPLYAYARAGQAVQATPREVTVHELALSRWDGPEAVSLRLRCSKGTYVRSLVADLGRALGPGAHVTALRRTRSGPFEIAAAQPLERLEAALAGAGPVPLLSPAAALAHLPSCFAGDAEARDLVHGKPVPWRALVAEAAADELAETAGLGRFCILRRDGSLLAVAERRRGGSQENAGAETVRTLRVFGKASSSPVV
jgi:tRNA pseudouridine55 synthase